MIMAFLMTQSFQNLFCQSLAALAALGPYLGQCKLTASGLGRNRGSAHILLLYL